MFICCTWYPLDEGDGVALADGVDREKQRVLAKRMRNKEPSFSQRGGWENDVRTESSTERQEPFMSVEEMAGLLDGASSAYPG